MRILVITKRQYTNKDLIDEQFGRVRELPLGLAAQGHTVVGYCLSYEKKETGIFEDCCSRSGASVTWHSLNTPWSKPLGLLSFAHRIYKDANSFKPDVIYATSDIFYGVIGHRLAQQLGCRFVFDLYDNYEAFASFRIPGMSRAFRYTLSQSDGITFVSSPLRDYILSRYNLNNPEITLVNGVDTSVFTPLDAAQARLQFDLSNATVNVGFCGAISADRNFPVVAQAFEKLKVKYPDLALLVAGTLDDSTLLSSVPGIQYLGNLPYSDMPAFYNSANVVVIGSSDSLQIKYGFPTKFYEILACQRPVVCADIGPAAELLRENLDVVFETASAESLANTIDYQLKAKKVLEIQVLSWLDLSQQLSDFLEQII